MKKGVTLLLALVAVASIVLFVSTRGSAGRDGDQVQVRLAARERTSVTPDSGQPEAKSDAEAALRTAVVPSVEEPSAGSGEAPRDDLSLLTVLVATKHDRRPLARARVFAFRKEPRSKGGAIHVDGTRGDLEHAPITGTEGRVELELPPGVGIQVSARDDERRSGMAVVDIPPLKPGETRSVTLELEVGDDLQLFGKVVTEEEGTPIDGARVLLIRASSSWHSSEGSGHSMEETFDQEELARLNTGPDGGFELKLASWMGPHLRVDAKGYALTLVDPEPGHETVEEALLIRLRRSATLRARVLDRRGFPIPEAIVRLETKGFNLRTTEQSGLSFRWISLPDEEWSRAADADGRCVFENLVPGVPLQVEARAPDGRVRREGDPFHFAPGEIREYEWKLGSGCRISGRTLDSEGAPVSGVKLWLARASGFARFDPYLRDTVVAMPTSGGDGTYVLEDVEPGSWWIGPAPETEFAPFPEDLEVPPDSDGIVHDVRVFRGLHIRGRVVDSRSAPVEWSWILASHEEKHWFVDVKGETDGSFELGPLVPGRYSLIARAMIQDAESEKVIASAGATDVVLQLRPGGSISGKALDSESGRGCPAEVGLALSKDDTSWSMWTTGSKEDGTFDFRGLLPNTYDVTVTTHDGRIGRQFGIVVEAGVETSGVVVHLGRGARLSIRYEATTGYGQFRVMSEGSAIGGDGIAAGNSIVQVVPPGRTIVYFTMPSSTEPETREVTLSIGEEKELVFSAPK